MRGSAVVVVGAQWGDEGKGKIVDHFAQQAEVVVRYQGGANAGHTLVVEGRKTVLHLVPSGILQPDRICMITAGCVVDPVSLLEEIDALVAAGVEVAPERLRLSRRAHLVLPVHKRLDKAREAAAGAGKIGTTGRGIGPTYEDAVARRGIRFVDLSDPGWLKQRLAGLLKERNLLLEAFGAEPFTVEELVGPLMEVAERLQPYLADTSLELAEARSKGARVLFEGAQGTLLDVLHGTYPYVTSSPTIGGGAATGTGIGPGVVDQVVGVTKAYCTRVGAGPFPSELDDEAGAALREAGAEYGATTGRPRRCGWLDAVALRYAVRVNGITELALTKLDVLSGVPELSVVVGYEIEGQRVTEFPAETWKLDALTPVLETLPGWTENIEAVRRFEDLPATAQAYIQRVEVLVGCPVGLVSVGPGRLAVFERDVDRSQGGA